MVIWRDHKLTDMAQCATRRPVLYGSALQQQQRAEIIVQDVCMVIWRDHKLTDTSNIYSNRQIHRWTLLCLLKRNLRV
ncbi:hypothetical protein Q7C36_003774 [Tachysurus vachellii]|uniref:Uncharacterized protein n=1 Tax=Tachysurus vachellii TaxID=175792 RepID=A0AA88NWX7_TACVA|nr:hypothetical protein Q7C36_003774 [Tachysurus vachellii]